MFLLTNKQDLVWNYIFSFSVSVDFPNSLHHGQQIKIYYDFDIDFIDNGVHTTRLLIKFYTVAKRDAEAYSYSRCIHTARHVLNPYGPQCGSRKASMIMKVPKLIEHALSCQKNVKTRDTYWARDRLDRHNIYVSGHVLSEPALSMIESAVNVL